MLIYPKRRFVQLSYAMRVIDDMTENGHCCPPSRFRWLSFILPVCTFFGMSHDTKNFEIFPIDYYHGNKVRCKI